MDLIKNNWNIDDYNNFINYLNSIKDIKYRDFQSKLGINTPIIGIRTNILKDISKNIFKGNYKDFLKICGNTYYEEITLYGFIITNIKDVNESIYYLDIFKNKIDNWASCDLFCSSYKIINYNKELFYNYIYSNINSNNLWIKRLCFVLLLNYYIDKIYIDKIFYLCDKYNTNDYYVEMSIAWLISICYIKYPKDTIKYIKNNKLNKFTHNKAIQKMQESKRVSSIDKETLNKLKIKNNTNYDIV